MSNPVASSSNYKAAKIVSLVVALILIIGWPISMIVSWSSIVNSDCRLAYLIGDLGLVSPLFVASWIGLQKQAAWGPYLFLVAAGALSYDCLHFGIYLIKIGFLSLSPFLYAGLVSLILLVLIVLVRKTIISLLNSH
jgi:hypothetical protein